MNVVGGGGRKNCAKLCLHQKFCFTTATSVFESILQRNENQRAGDRAVRLVLLTVRQSMPFH